MKSFNIRLLYFFYLTALFPTKLAIHYLAHMHHKLDKLCDVVSMHTEQSSYMYKKVDYKSLYIFYLYIDLQPSFVTFVNNLPLEMAKMVRFRNFTLHIEELTFLLIII